MYYAEMIIDGVLCFRTSPNSDWIQFTAEQLTSRLIEMGMNVGLK